MEILTVNLVLNACNRKLHPTNNKEHHSLSNTGSFSCTHKTSSHWIYRTLIIPRLRSIRSRFRFRFRSRLHWQDKGNPGNCHMIIILFFFLFTKVLKSIRNYGLCRVYGVSKNLSHGCVLCLGCCSFFVQGLRELATWFAKWFKTNLTFSVLADPYVVLYDL